MTKTDAVVSSTMRVLQSATDEALRKAEQHFKGEIAQERERLAFRSERVERRFDAVCGLQKELEQKSAALEAELEAADSEERREHIRGFVRGLRLAAEKMREVTR